MKPSPDRANAMSDRAGSSATQWRPPPADPEGLRVLLAALCCPTGDLAANLLSHRETLRAAAEAGCHLAVFPEMSLTGSVDPRTEPDRLIGLDSAVVDALVAATQEFSTAAVFGLAERAADGGCHITQVWACQGRLVGVYRKRHLGDGEEAYTPGTGPAEFNFGAARFGIAICAEGAVDYPFDEPVAAGADVVLFCAAPGLDGRRSSEESWREGFAWWETAGLGDARRHAQRTRAWVALATQAGSTADEDFPGLAAVVAPDGKVVARLADWRPGTLVVDLPVKVEVEPVRHAARVLVVDAAGRALLVCFRDGAGNTWWAPPGGGLEKGEDHLGAARRELAEELGRDDIDIGPPIGWRSHTVSFDGGRWITQRERWFLARCDSIDIAVEPTAALIAEHVTEVRWWSSKEMADAAMTTSPRQLAGLLAEVNGGRIPGADTNLGV